MKITKNLSEQDLSEYHAKIGPFAIGFRDCQWSLLNQETIKAGMWYPAVNSTSKNILYMGCIEGKAKRTARLAEIETPLVMISHGSGGNRFDQFYLAEFLASYGYIVVAVEHVTYSPGQLDGIVGLCQRPRNISFVIDQLLEDESLTHFINPEKIYIAGFSAGGFASLALAGAIPDFTRDDSFKDFLDHIRSNDLKFNDDRIKKIILMAPGLAHLFSEKELKLIETPICLFTSGQDEIIADPSSYLLNNIDTIYKHIKFTEADHYIYNMQCPPLFEKLFKLSCADKGIKREKVHPCLLVECLDFLNEKFIR